MKVGVSVAVSMVGNLMLGNYDCIMVADIAVGLQLPPLLAVSPR